jgi:F-type H+-transporting ATPase subunit b
MINFFNGACELKRKVAIALFAVILLSFIAAPTVAYAREGGQEHPPAQSAAAEHAQDAHGEAEAHEVSLAAMLKSMMWPTINFIIFVGILYYLLNKPFAEYLAGRSATIRRDLVDAAALRDNATAQLAAIDQKLQALPGELTTLRTRGAEDIKAEEQRIAAAAAADRERLLEQTRREIDLQVRLAKKEILEHAADLSVQLATDRIKKEVTPADQDRLVDRYLSQVKEKK